MGVSMFSEVLGKAGYWLIGLCALFAAALQFPDMLGGVGGVGPAAITRGPDGTSGRDEPSARRPAGSIVELKAGHNGHFQTEADVNGRSIDVMVDTGASMVALTWEDAERAGIFVRDADFKGTASTANGKARYAPVVIDRIAIGDVIVRNVHGAVMERGKLTTTLLGMSFLGKLDRAEMRAGRLILEN